MKGGVLIHPSEDIEFLIDESFDCVGTEIVSRVCNNPVCKLA